MYAILHIKQEVDDVAVLHDVFLAFGAEQALCLGGGHVAAGLQILKGHSFCADKAALDVRVDLAGSSGSLGALGDGPCTDFVLTAGEEGDVAQQIIAGVDQTMPCACMASATFRKPAILAPAT